MRAASAHPPYDAHRFERLLADLSARFVNLAPAEVDEAIVDALRQIVELLEVDRCILIRFAESGDEVFVTHSWAVAGVPAVAPKFIEHSFPWVLGKVRDGDAVVLPRTDAMPPEAAVDAESFARAGSKSNLTMPMIVAGRVEGAMAFACLRRSRDWPDALVERIRVLAGVFGNALAHKRARESLDGSMRFERVVSDVLAGLFSLGSGEQDGAVESGLRAMGRALGAERTTLWRRVADEEAFVMTHTWVAEGARRPPDSVSTEIAPWLVGQLLRGVPVIFGSHADLPPESAADRTWLAANRIRSGIAVPLSVSGAVVGALSFGLSHDRGDWPGEIVSRARLLGEVYASLFARRESEQRERDAQALAAHAARVGTMGMFAASLVHELTQPLAASLANAETASELLAVSSPDLAELRATVADIVADDRRAGELIQQLRRFLRRGDVDRTEVDVRELLSGVLRLAQAAADDHGATVTLDLAGTLPRVTGDRVQLEQVFLNLILNAIDAVAARPPASRTVVLSVHPSAAGVAVEVADQGVGMDEATQKRVFEPFFTTKERGMGLGLAISRTIVATHGGTLAVRSAAGQGTTFRVDLPVQLPVHDRPPQSATPHGVGAGVVYVIDDDASMRRALERQLESAGHRVVSYDSATSFLDDLPAPRGPACVLSDVRMPGRSGLDLQQTLAEAERMLPIVFISGHGDVATAAHAMKAGAVNFIAKPFNRDALLAAVGEALARWRALDADQSERADVRRRFDSLTPREREVFELVAAGLLNKVIADRLGAAEATVKIHRGRVMEKMAADSVADLVRMAERLGSRKSAST